MTQIEYEVRFLLNLEQKQVIQSKLHELGYKQLDDPVLMQRAIFDPIDHQGSDDWRWLRIRTEGRSTSLCFKHVIDNKKVDGTTEIEFSTDASLEKVVSLFQAMGLKVRTYQENQRTFYTSSKNNKEIQITFDQWPWLPELLEIEADSEEKVTDIVSKLGLNMDDAILGNPIDAYAKIYDFDSRLFDTYHDTRLDSPRPSFMIPKSERRPS